MLIIGAFGGIGTYAVQLAKTFQAHVTGACSPRKADLVRSPGADQAIDHTREDFTDRADRYDVVIDIGGNSSRARRRQALTTDGTLIIVGSEGRGRGFGGIDRQFCASLLSPVTRQKLGTFVNRKNLADMLVIKQLIEAGDATPAIDRTYHSMPRRKRSYSRRTRPRQGRHHGRSIRRLVTHRPDRPRRRHCIAPLPHPAQETTMANRTQQPLQKMGHPASIQPPLLVRSIRRASVIAGASLLLMAVLAGFGYMVAVQGLVTYDDAAQNASNIIEASTLFGSGIVSLFIVIALDVVVAWTLYRVFAPVNSTLSAVAAWMRIVYGGIFAVAVAQLVGVLRLLTTGSPTTMGTDLRYAEALAGANRFADIYDAGLILFGLHLLVIGWLAFKAGYVPKWLGVLLVVSGAGYVIDGVGPLLSPGSWTDVSTVTFIGEFLLAVWLVTRGRRITLSDGGHSHGTTRHAVQHACVGDQDISVRPEG